MTNIVFTNSNKTSTKLVSRNDKDVEVTLPSVNGKLCTEENVKDVIRPEKLEKIKNLLTDNIYIDIRNRTFNVGEGELFETLEEALLVTNYIVHMVNKENGFSLTALTFRLKAGYNWTKPIDLINIKHISILIEGDGKGKINIPSVLNKSLLTVDKCSGIHIGNLEINQDIVSNIEAILINGSYSNIYFSGCKITLNIESKNSVSNSNRIYFFFNCTMVYLCYNSITLKIKSMPVNNRNFFVIYNLQCNNIYVFNNNIDVTLDNINTNILEIIFISLHVNSRGATSANTYKIRSNLLEPTASKLELTFIYVGVGSYLHMRQSNFHFLNEFKALIIYITKVHYTSNITPDSSVIHGLSDSMVSYTYLSHLRYLSGFMSYGGWKVKRGSARPTISNIPVDTYTVNGYMQSIAFGEEP